MYSVGCDLPGFFDFFFFFNDKLSSEFVILQEKAEN